MSQELHYTSSPRGLKSGSRGFCTVACTAGLSPTLAERLEGLSGYRPKYPPHHPEAAQNPVNWSHLRLSVAGQTVSVLGRVGPAGLDYTDRPNKYAHHVVLESGERVVGGPAWLLTQPGFMETAWTGTPQILPAGRRPPTGDRPVSVCRAWAERVGDAGWAGVLAESFLADPKRPAIFVYDPGTDVLGLFVEALALLPADRRWEVTFSTFYTGLPAGTTCTWRGVLRDSPEERQVRANPEALILDLGQTLGLAQGGALVNAARTGEPVETSLPSPQTAASSASGLASSSSPRQTHSPSRRTLSAAPAPRLAEEPPYALEAVAEYPMVRPPLVPKAQVRSPETAASHARWPLWPLVSAAAVAFLVGVALGGAGVAYMLARSPNVQVVAIAPKATGPKVQRTMTEKAEVVLPPSSSADSKKNESGNRSGGESPKTVKEENSNAEVVAEKVTREPTLKTLSVGPAAGNPTGDRKSQSKDSSQSQSGDGERDDVKGKEVRIQDRMITQKSTKKKPGVIKESAPQPSASSQKSATASGPIPVKFITLPQGVPDSTELGGSSAKLTTELPIRRVELIGLKDKANQSHHFAKKKSDAKNSLTITHTEDTSIIDVCKFTWEDCKVSFRWSPLFEEGKEVEKDAIRDCVLLVELINGHREHYLLWNPRIKQLPGKLESLLKNKSTVFHDENIEMQFSWYDTDSKSIENTRSQLKPRLFSFKLFDDGNSIADLKQTPNSNMLESTDKFARAEIVDEHFFDKIRITINKPSDNRIRILKKEAFTESRTEEDSMKGKKNVQEPNPKKDEEYRKAEQRFNLGNKFLKARMEATVTVKVEDQEFSLPVLESKGGDR